MGNARNAAAEYDGHAGNAAAGNAAARNAAARNAAARNATTKHAAAEHDGSGHATTKHDGSGHAAGRYDGHAGYATAGYATRWRHDGNEQSDARHVNAASATATTSTGAISI